MIVAIAIVPLYSSHAVWKLFHLLQDRIDTGYRCRAIVLYTRERKTRVIRPRAGLSIVGLGDFQPTYRAPYESIKLSSSCSVTRLLEKACFGFADSNEPYGL